MGNWRSTLETVVSMNHRQNIGLIQRAYQRKKVFVTGHTGFKGAWLVQWLTLLGAEVKGYALAPEGEISLFTLLGGVSLGESVIADIRNKEKLKEALLSFQPDYVFHLAAQPLVRLSYEIPAETFEVNALGTAYLLDAVRQLDKACSLVLITTDKVYENKEWLYPYRESDRLGGFDPYSASKACTELVISSYRNSFFASSTLAKHQKGIATARAGNVIGGGDWSKDRIIPDILRALGASKPVNVRNPDAIRPWQHVLEPLFGYLLLGANLAAEPVKFGKAWNFGPYPHDSLTVGELVKTAIAHWGSGEMIVEKLANQPHEAGLLRLDISLAIIELGWEPVFSAKQAIEHTLDWYKAYFQNPNAIAAETIKSITDFMQSDA